MIQERAIIQFLVNREISGDVSKLLAMHGYVNATGAPFSISQVNSLLHSARQEKRKLQRKPVETCGIDREKNPCGDASDY